MAAPIGLPMAVASVRRGIKHGLPPAAAVSARHALPRAEVSTLRERLPGEAGIPLLMAAEGVAAAIAGVNRLFGSSISFFPLGPVPFSAWGRADFFLADTDSPPDRANKVE